LSVAAASLPGIRETADDVRYAHMRGELWSMARDGLVYAFRCSPTSFALDGMPMPKVV